MLQAVPKDSALLPTLVKCKVDIQVLPPTSDEVGFEPSKHQSPIPLNPFPRALMVYKAEIQESKKSLHPAPKIMIPTSCLPHVQSDRGAALFAVTLVSAVLLFRLR